MDIKVYPDIVEEPAVTAVLDEARQKWNRIDDAYAGLQWNLVHDFNSGRPISTSTGPIIVFKRGPGREAGDAPIIVAVCKRQGPGKIVILHLTVHFPDDW